MSGEDVSVDIDAALLAAAFPSRHRAAAMAAGSSMARRISSRYWFGQFAAKVEGDIVLIPVRLHFASSRLSLPTYGRSRAFSRALRTRSTDGFERQRAVGDLLRRPEAWGAPFIVALIGEYVIEILDDISASLTPELEQVLGAFILDNRALWETTKRRVTSYWNEYYRSRRGDGSRQLFSRDEYVGFRIVERLDAAALRHS